MIKVKVKLSLCSTEHHAMKTYWGGDGVDLATPALKKGKLHDVK
jgi:hypothetical protein